MASKFPLSVIGVIHFMVTQDLAVYSKDGICIPIREKWLKRQMCVLWIEFCYSGKYLWRKCCYIEIAVYCNKSFNYQSYL